MNESHQPIGCDAGNNPLGMLTLDDALVITDCDSRFRQIFDCNIDHLKDRPFEELFSDKDKKGLTDFHRHISQYQSGFIEQTAHLHIKQHDYYTHLRLIKNNSDWLLFLENLHDDSISLLGTLVRCQDRFKSVIKNSSDGIIILDENNNLTEFNKIIFEILAIRNKQGIPVNEDAIIGRNFFELTGPAFVHIQDIIATTRVNKKAQLKQPVQYQNYALALDITPIFQPAKGFIGTCVIIHDQTAHHKLEKLAQKLADNEIKIAKANNTERLKLETQLRQAQKMEAIGQLTGGIAHDFNNILTGILGNAELGLETVTEVAQPKLAKYLKNILRSGKRAQELIRQMLVFSRGQRGEFSTLILEPVVYDAINLLGLSLPSTIELQADIREKTGAVKLDPLQIGQVLMNLCINAHDAMDGAGNVTISLHNRNNLDRVCTACSRKFRGDFVELAVTDSGPGIDQQTIERMFEPFFSTKDVGKGTGMGLSMVHGIVHEHDGHIIVESKPNAGATFRILFPLVSVNQDQDTPDQTIIASTEKSGSLNGRILLVDDEEMVAEFMQDLLESRGLTVSTHASSQEARNAFRQDPDRYDLIITDQTMPKITGTELAQYCLRLKPNIPIILYTGHSEKLSEAYVEELGIRGFLKKPVDIDALMQILRTILDPSAISNS